MIKSRYKKIFVLGILLFFIGASIVPNISGNVGKSVIRSTNEIVTNFLLSNDYDNAYWEFDEESNKYYRYQGNVDLYEDVEPEYILLTDAAHNDQPITADNVIILFVPHDFLYKSGRSEVFDIQLEGMGKAYIFRNGSAFEAKWERKERDKPLYILRKNGSNFPLKPGTTFFQVVTTRSEMKFEGNEWTFKFIRPLDP